VLGTYLGTVPDAAPHEVPDSPPKMEVEIRESVEVAYRYAFEHSYIQSDVARSEDGPMLIAIINGPEGSW
jgi:hypothetical protein